MYRNYYHQSPVAALGRIAVTLIICISLIGCQQREQSKLTQQKDRLGEELTMESVMRVAPGSDVLAYQYYKETFGELGLNQEGLSGEQLVDTQTLALMLKFLGYQGLKAEDLEDLPSVDLMSRFPGSLLASSFFAPKITDVSVDQSEIREQILVDCWC